MIDSLLHGNIAQHPGLRHNRTLDSQFSTCGDSYLI